jgi:hypothetical protein
LEDFGGQGRDDVGSLDEGEGGVVVGLMGFDLRGFERGLTQSALKRFLQIQERE